MNDLALKDTVKLYVPCKLYTLHDSFPQTYIISKV